MTPDERLAKVAEVLAGHGPSGFVSGRDGWVECRCGERLPCVLDSSGYPLDEEAEDTLFARHRAEALAPLLDTFRAEDEARALREAADEAAERGDIGKPDGPEAWTWLRGRAEQIGGGA